MGDRWLETELARQLTPVAAPESLWDRINGIGCAKEGRPARTQRRMPVGWAFVAVAAAVVIAGAVGVVRVRHAGSGEDRFTQREVALVARHAGFDFRAANFDDARRFVKSRANIDIDLPRRHPVANSGPARVLGVRMVELDGVPIAAIDYAVKGEQATLYVSGKRAGLKGDDMGPSLHLHSRQGLTYWNMRDETYTIAFASTKNPHGACMLCHATAPAGSDAPQNELESQPGM
jgi:hypothetical protein